jgi:hypothetical protein
MSHEITLPLGASAEPDTCGSCKHFRRRDDGMSPSSGECYITFPPMIASKYDLGPVENSNQFIRTADHKRCDLQRPDGKTYIVQRRVG